MRPPLNAGENAAVGAALAPALAASMRPPLNAGENVTDATATTRSLPLQ